MNSGGGNAVKAELPWRMPAAGTDRVLFLRGAGAKCGRVSRVGVLRLCYVEKLFFIRIVFNLILPPSRVSK